VLRHQGRLGSYQWRHEVVHPLIGYRVLRDMPGGGEPVSQAVLRRHERRDGFGYRQGRSQDEIPLRGEILGAAEWLAGTMRNGRGDGIASTASRLIPEAFWPGIGGAIAAVFRGETSSANPRSARRGTC
jgi:hypothetical protein